MVSHLVFSTMRWHFMLMVAVVLGTFTNEVRNYTGFDTAVVYLNNFTEEYNGKRVVTGITEATVIENLRTQFSVNINSIKYIIRR